MSERSERIARSVAGFFRNRASFSFMRRGQAHFFLAPGRADSARSAAGFFRRRASRHGDSEQTTRRRRHTSEATKGSGDERDGAVRDGSER